MAVTWAWRSRNAPLQTVIKRFFSCLRYILHEISLKNSMILMVFSRYLMYDKKSRKLMIRKIKKLDFSENTC